MHIINNIRLEENMWESRQSVLGVWRFEGRT